MEQIKIPAPPDWLIDSFISVGKFAPAPDLNKFIADTFLAEGSELYNPEHVHLSAADIGFLWTNAPNRRRMKRVVGEAEMPNPKGGAWQKARAERQLIEWFGGVPDFVITLDAEFADEVSEVEFLALLEHEIYHCGQAVDEFGLPKFRKSDGAPIFGMRGHDVEQFTGIVRRYGIGAAGVDAVDFVKAALETPEIGSVRVAQLCGTCSA